MAEERRDPSPIQRSANRLRWYLRRGTCALRVLPDFLIVGAQKAGTTSLHNYLAEHPQLCSPARRKELHFFDRFFDCGVGHYRAWFPTALGRRLRAMRSGTPVLCFESTPEYMAFPETRERMHTLLGPIPLVVVLRDPIERLWSAYRMYHSLWNVTEDLGEVLDADPDLALHEGREPTHSSPSLTKFLQTEALLSRGLYARDLEALYELWPRERVHIFDFAELTQDPGAVCARLLESFDLPPLERDSWPIFNKGHGPLLPEEHRARLASYYQGPDERLRELLGWEPAWMREG